jgi:hypothetical protein
MIDIINAEAISRRKALTLLGLLTAAFAASSIVAAPDAEAQRSVWSAVREDARVARSGARPGAPAARRGVKKDASDYHPDARAGFEQKIRSALPARSQFAAATPRHQ